MAESAFWEKLIVLYMAGEPLTLTTQSLSPLVGTQLRSDLDTRVSYRLVRPIGEGGMGTAFFALRAAVDGVSPAVVKVANPELVLRSGQTASLAFRKEAVALGRLNERVPPTPYVVRLIDVGTIDCVAGRTRTQLPWLAVEYIHGGAEGTTLEERVLYAVQRTRFAFDPARAVRAIECMGAGVQAIHEVGVIHRDLKPNNVLCCGFGSDEICKIADFGAARPSGMAGTFGDVLLGTPGYAAPEQTFSDLGELSHRTDVFSLAAVCFFMLTGEPLFEAPHAPLVLMMVRQRERRGILSAQALCPELREQPAVCAAVDTAIARGTSPVPEERPPTAELFAANLCSVLRSGPPSTLAASKRRVHSVVSSESGLHTERRSWTVRHPPGDPRIIRSFAWIGDGHGLALTVHGLDFWDGTRWRESPLPDSVPFNALRFVAQVRPDTWLLGGAGATVALYSMTGARDVMLGPDRSVTFTLGNGDPSDLAAIVGERGIGRTLLYALTARRWCRPLELPDGVVINSLARVDDARWLVCGRTHAGAGYAALYCPLDFEVIPLVAGGTHPLVSCSGQPQRALSLAVGRSGSVVEITGDRATPQPIPGDPDLASVSVDIVGHAWAAASGRLWQRREGSSWRLAWEDRSWVAPFVTLWSDVGIVYAMTVDGAVLEGRLE